MTDGFERSRIMLISQRLFLAALLALALAGCRGPADSSSWWQRSRQNLFGSPAKPTVADTKTRALEAQKQALEAENRKLATQVKELLAEKEQAEKETARLSEELALSGGSSVQSQIAAGQGRGARAEKQR
jgi:cell division protein FtsB